MPALVIFVAAAAFAVAEFVFGFEIGIRVT
jgi:hypothetical protein